MANTFSEIDHPRGQAGQFTTKHHAEATGLSLSAPAPAAFDSREFTWLASDHHQMSVLKEISDQVRETHPDATAIRAKPTHDGSTTVEWLNADGPAGILEQNEDLDFYPQDIIVSVSQVNEFEPNHGWMSLDDIDDRHKEVSESYAAAVHEAVSATNRTSAT